MNKSEREDYITIDEIKEILTSYRIGKKPLAKLLGWGETTIIRYMEGDIPTREYSDKLQYIKQNPAYFYQLLEQNKESLTAVAYRKSSEAVKACMLESKIRIVAQYIINRMDGHISLYELETYLYYVQSFHLALRDAALFDDDYIVNEIDMPYKTVYEDFTIRTITVMELDKNALTKEEMAFINAIVEAMSWYGPAVLCKMLHFELLMLKQSQDDKNQKIITKESLAAYFKEMLAANEVTAPEHTHKYLHAMYIKLTQTEWDL